MGGDQPESAPTDGSTHISCLSSMNKVEIKEKVNAIEALTAMLGQEIEMANRYKVFTDGGSEELFYIVEQTDCMMRQVKQCCPDCAPWKVSMFYTRNGANQLVYNITRDATCTFCCFNRPVINVTDVTTGEKIGSARDPWAFCDLTFTIRDPQNEPVLNVNGGCCQPGLWCPLPCGPCAEVNFPITDAKSSAKVGHIQKRVPGCCKFLIADDVDNYNVDFGEVEHPQYKAMVIAMAIFIDFRFFSNNSADNGGGGGGDGGGDGGDGGGE
eukprot:NODE_13439_length_1165_cov_13.684971.p1 GENE.NODE_13439_length_1165_cov_13.684971~~NODE_13439_length_1165_cov_13.684971.p1  ORF type:complete len:280 (+),score=54.08 NODE_13439_length_1165_cov_13.684971:34-840(+)